MTTDRRNFVRNAALGLASGAVASGFAAAASPAAANKAADGNDLARYIVNPGPKETARSLKAACSTGSAITTETILKVLRAGGNAADARGILTHSSGNHGAAIALATPTRGVPAHIVVPKNAIASKVEKIRRHAGRIVFCEPTPAGRAQTVERVRHETGAVLVHPYDDAVIIAGQGTAALKLIEAHADIEVLVAPVGGGGLLSGSALVAKALLPAVKVLGAEPEAADDAARSLRAGRLIPQTDPRTMADGLRTSLGERNFALIRQHVDGIVTVSEAAIVAAMRLAWSVLKIVIEPSSAVPLAAVLAAPEAVRGRRVGVILSGGNVDLASLPWSW